MAGLLALGTVVGFETQAPLVPAEAATPTVECKGTTNANSVEVTPSHGKGFYIDTGQGQNINAAYVGYRIKNTKATAISDLWVKLDGFEDDVIQLAHPNDELNQIGPVSAGATVPAFFLLRADRSTTAPQTHNVRVYEGNPSLEGSTELYSCFYTFTRVRETIKAAANKVESISSAPAVVQIGSNLVVTHKGLTGVIGAGGTPDGSIVWLSPASNASWPTRAFKLISTSVTFYQTKSFSGQNEAFQNQLLIPNASGILGQQRPSSYEATYTFKIIGRAPATVAPVAQIASGTQIKHTDMSGFYNTDGTAKFSVSSATAEVKLTTSKDLQKNPTTATAVRAASSNVEIDYEVTLVNSDTANALSVDKIVDTASSSLSYKSGSLAVSQTNSSNVTSTVTSVTSPIASGAGDTKDWTFGGAISVPAGGKLTLKYTMDTPCTGGQISLSNRAVSHIGDLRIGSSSTTVSVVEATLTTTSGAACEITNVEAGAKEENTGVEVFTGAATNLKTELVNNEPSSSGTLTGQVDSNGNAGKLIQCELSTEASLAGSTLRNASTPGNSLTTSSAEPIQVACDVTGLIPGTTYHYRILVEGVLGQILSFSTPPPVAAAPTAVTNSPSNFRQGTGSDKNYYVTFNSTVNALGNVTRVRYEWAATSSRTATNCDSLGTSTFITFLDINENDAAVNLILSGGFATQVGFEVAFTNTDARCYRVLADYPFDAGTPTTTTLAGTTTVTGAWVNFAPSGTNPPIANTAAATSITATTATLNGSVEAGGATATNQFCYVATEPAAGSGTLSGCLGGVRAASPGTFAKDLSGSISFSASGLTAGTRYWFQAIATDGTRTSYGNIETFITPGKPIATTNQASTVLATTATINGTVSANGSITSVVFCFVADSDTAGKALVSGVMSKCWDSATSNLRETTNPTVTTDLTANQTAVRSANLTGLTASTKYRFQVLAENTAGITAGALEEFTTADAALAPTVTTGDASSITHNSATLAGNVTAGNAPTSAKFCFGTAANLAGCELVSATPSTVNGNTETAISVQLSNLTPETKYFYRAIGNNGTGGDANGDVNGLIKNFTTEEAPLEVDILFVDPEAPEVEGSETLVENGDIRITYGDDFYELLADRHAPRAKSKGNSIGGQFTQKLGGTTEIAARVAGTNNNVLPVGTHNVTVSFKPNDGKDKTITGPQRRIFVDPKPFTISARNKSKLKGQLDPEAFPFTTAGAFALGDTDPLGDIEVERVLSDDPDYDPESVGSHTIAPTTKVNNGNYLVTKNSATLFISDLRVLGEETPDGSIEVSKDVVCECENFKPGTVATLTVTRTGDLVTASTAGGFFAFGVFSTQTWFSILVEEDPDILPMTVEIDENGECPLLKITDLPDGQYEVNIDGTSPADETLTQNLNVNVINITETDTGDGSGGGGDGDGDGDGTGGGTDDEDGGTGGGTDDGGVGGTGDGGTGDDTDDSGTPGGGGSSAPPGTTPGDTTAPPVEPIGGGGLVTAPPPALANTGFNSWWLPLWALLLVSLGLMTVATNRRKL
jgi:hypothetical protein